MQVKRRASPLQAGGIVKNVKEKCHNGKLCQRRTLYEHATPDPSSRQLTLETFSHWFSKSISLPSSGSNKLCTLMLPNIILSPR